MNNLKKTWFFSPEILLIILPPLFWAGNFIIGRALYNTVPPMTISLWRWCIALICILPFAWKGLCSDYKIYLEHKWLLFRVSLTGIVTFNFLVYIGLHDTSASNALLLNSSVPILIALFGKLFFKQKLILIQSIGLLVSFFGVFIIISHGNWRTISSFSHGDLIIFLGMIAFSFYTIWLRSLPKGLDPLGLITIQIAIALIFIIPLWGIERSHGFVSTWNSSNIIALIYLGIFPSFLAYLMYGIGVKKFGPIRAGLSIHLIPIFGVILAVTFLNEKLHLYHIIGFITILFGIKLAMHNKAN